LFMLNKKNFHKVQLMLKLLSSFVLLSSFAFSQEIDSLLNQNIRTIPDTNFVQIIDTTAVSDSLITAKVKVDTLAPIKGMPLADVSTIINKKTILFENYRYTGDLLRSFSVNFIKDLGFVGYPSETFIYGIGNSGISYLQDGVFWNNRYTNSLDLNLIQSEDIDSIEIVPSPRGFLYGPYNNPVTVNFITKDFIPPVPYARVRYYEGPDGEAMIDGKFSAMVAKRWNYSFQLTNRSKDETYENTELSLWLFNTKLKYFLSNSVNLQAYYYYVDKEQGLNGGVDFDSLTRSSDDPTTDLYDPFFAPVVSPNQKLDVLQHNVGLRTLAKPFDNSQLDLSIYYRYGLDEYRNTRDTLDFGRDYTNKSFGTVFNYLHKIDIFTFQLLGDYESIDNKLFWRSDNYTGSNKYDRFSFGGGLTAGFFDNYIKASLYYKQNYWEVQGEDRISLNGMGADLIFLPAYEQSLYIGYSLRESLSEEENVPTFELGTRYRNSQLLLDIKYFNIEHFYESHLEIYPPWWYYTQKVRGLGLIFNYKYSIFLLETNTSYYFEIDDERPINLPDWQFIGGIYINDFFFDNNLDLKAGFNFCYKGKTNFAFDYWGSSGSVEPTNKLDFNLAGEIKNVFIFYFQWENVFGNEYYITPYYPMPERNIKFGLAWELFN
jgi:hypothetical protein